MKLTLETPKRSLNKAFLKQRPLREEIDLFKQNLLNLLGSIDEIEREENQKNHVRDFLRDTFYKGNNEINTKDSKDLVIHLGKTNKDKVGVIIEAKRPSNKAEMISVARPNAKAFHELVLYYLRERIDDNNIDIKHCVITNINEWYIFDASYFEKLFFRNKFLTKEYEQWRSGMKVTKDTHLFYNEIIKPFIDSLDVEIPCTYFDIRQYNSALSRNSDIDDKNLIALYKILSPNHLLGLPFIDDSNQLNSNFYKELLHIIGLEEAKEAGKPIIRRKEEDIDAGSLIENTINILETEELYKVGDIAVFGKSRKEQLFNIGLELCITWINRILFLKLLEAQVVNYHGGDKSYRFLNSTYIPDYDELYKLFHQVLARPINERSDTIRQKYGKVPYLNSYLFDIQEGSLEDLTIKINSLDNLTKIKLYSNSVLHDEKRKNKTIGTLDYLFKFLDSFDFASEGVEDIRDENKTLINASVLGKVFEKINGYKDGSIYTPGFITMFMCREALRLTVLQKFRDTYNWTVENFDDLKNHIADRKTSKEILELNSVVNSIKVCDPAVGSGHYLVSSLNEFIAIKSDLGILADSNGVRIRDYEIIIENDELIVTDYDGDIFEYKVINGRPQTKEIQTLQKTLFYEKQNIIENCLFGVDINPNSVKICRLRLWIELLKNAYYKEDTHYSELETLPNIDINIKCGNSLLSRFSLDADLNKALKSIEYTVEEYRNFVNSYKNERNRDEKRGLQKLIDGIKKDFKTYVGKDSKEQKKLDKLSSELFDKYQTEKLFFQKLSSEQLKEKASLEKQVEAQKKIIEDITSSVIYKNAFEWRFEFPEVLNNNGNFEGFDLVIANPPYIRQEELGAIKGHLKDRYDVFISGGDIFSYFYELGHSILRPDGKFAFINNTFDKTTAGRVLREFVSNKFHIVKYIDFTGVVVFEEATTYPIILIAEKGKSPSYFKYLKFNKETFSNKGLLYKPEIYDFVSQSSLNSSAWNFLDEVGARIINQISTHTPLLQKYGKCYYGIKTALNEAFVTDKNLGNDSVLKPVYDGKDIKKWSAPLPTKQMIVFQSKSTKKSFGNLEEEEAEQKMEKAYPKIFSHLIPYKAAAKKRFDKGDYWWELRNCAYYKLFAKEKIIFPNLQNTNKFAMDSGGNFLNAPAVFLPSSDKHLIALLNSKVVWHFLKSVCVVRNGGYIEVKPQYFEQIPIPELSADIKQVLETLADYIIFLNSITLLEVNDKLIPIYFEQIIDGIVIEQYFPTLLKEHNREIVKHLGQISSAIESSEENKLKEIKKLFDRLNQKDHSVRTNLFYLDSIPEIRIIFGK